MNRYLGALAGLALLFGTSAAIAEEATGKIQSIDQAERTIVMEDGTKYKLAQGVAIEGLSSGQEVTVTFEEEAGEKVASEVKPKE